MPPTLPCHVDQKPCEVVDLFAGDLAAVDPEDQTWNLLPCQRCRDGDQAALRLEGTRLGRHERRVLLEARPSGGSPGPLPPEDDSRSSHEALQRAIRKLEKHGLVERSWVGGGKWEAGSRMVVGRTALGDAVTLYLRRLLLTRSPIRWRNYLGAIRRRARIRSPELLLLEFRRALEAFVARDEAPEREPSGLLAALESTSPPGETRLEAVQGARAKIRAIGVAQHRRSTEAKRSPIRTPAGPDLSSQETSQPLLFPDLNGD